MRRYGVDLNILHGQIDEIQDQTFGSLAVYASGEADRCRPPWRTCAVPACTVQEVAGRLERPCRIGSRPRCWTCSCTSLWETLVMVGISGVVGALVGLPLGVALRLTDRGGVLEHAISTSGGHGS
jgi:hypothetical protein